MSLFSSEASVLKRLNQDQFRHALRALLRRPLLNSANPDHRDDFSTVLRQSEELRTWFAKNAGWTLETSQDCARLYKIPARIEDATRPAQHDDNDPPFSRTRYVILCLVLAALIRGQNQTTLGRIAEAVCDSLKNNPAFSSLSFNLDSIDARRDFIAAIRLLIR